MSHLGRNARRIAMFTTCMATLTASQLCSAALLDGMWPFNSNEEKHLQAWEPDPTQALRWGEWERLKLAPSGTNTPNQHPVQLSPEQIAKTLMSIQVRPFHDDYPLFSEEELKRFATPIAIALAKAAPNQDVEFLSMGQHGIIGIVAPSLGTSGRIFYADGRLNVILGMAQKDFLSDYLRGSRRAPVFNFGSHKTPAPGVMIVGVDQGDGKLVRNDWISLAIVTPRPVTTPPGALAPASASTQAPTTQVTPQATPIDPAEALIRKSEARLKALQRLKNEGLLSDEEYRQKRAEILKDL